MKKPERKILFVSVICLLFVSDSLAQNYKIRQTMSMNGQKSETTIYVRGSRQRTESGGMMGMGADIATVEQCDLKRSIQINDGKKLYFIEPFNDASDAATTDKSAVRNQNSPTQKGGTVTMTNNITDTGERKQMFGLTARHLKTVMTMQASPGACSDTNMRIETDGWYVDLPQFSCPIQPPKNPFAGMSDGRGGCQDRFIIKQTGGGKIGFPLTETRTMKMGDDEDMPTLTQTVETIEFSNAPLDAAKFDVPKDYAQAKTSQELYGSGGAEMRRMIQNSKNESSEDNTPKSNSSRNNSMNSAPINQPIGKKKAGTIRIGVYAPTNRAGENVSTSNLLMYLIQKLTGGNVEAVAVASEAEARATGCDYVLTSDFSKLKQSTASKIGGMFGKITNTDASAAQKYDVQVDFKLTSTDGQMIMQNKAAQKIEGNAETVAETVLEQEAQAVLTKAK